MRHELSREQLEGLGRRAESAITVEQLRALRYELTGRDHALAALTALVDAEPGLEARLEQRIAPAILRLASQLGQAALPAHQIGQPAMTTLPRSEAAGWVAHLVLGTLDAGPGYPRIDFAPLLATVWRAELAKLRCILEYFDRCASSAPRGMLQIERRVVSPRPAGGWASDTSPLLPVELRLDGGIEEATDCLQVDFANRYLGGGVLSGGCVQEEIRFAVSPELLAAMIVSPPMDDNEAIIVRGIERFAVTGGYGWTLAYSGPFHDPSPCNKDGTPDIELVAIDAIDYRGEDAATQYNESSILRELNKARAGFARDGRSRPVATGNWGCGAFLGDPCLKAVIQWLAASAEARPIRYFTFGDKRISSFGDFAFATIGRCPNVGTLFERLLATRGCDSQSLFSQLLR